VDAVLARVNSYRAGLGAMQNRFDLTKDNLSTSVENASAARSRVKDADMAEETSNLARIQVVQQAGVAMLAQANNSASRALELLR
jgi:flagellin